MSWEPWHLGGPLGADVSPRFLQQDRHFKQATEVSRGRGKKPPSNLVHRYRWAYSEGQTPYGIPAAPAPSLLSGHRRRLCSARPAKIFSTASGFPQEYPELSDHAPLLPCFLDSPSSPSLAANVMKGRRGSSGIGQLDAKRHRQVCPSMSLPLAERSRVGGRLLVKITISPSTVFFSPSTTNQSTIYLSAVHFPLCIMCFISYLLALPSRVELEGALEFLLCFFAGGCGLQPSRC